VKRGRAHKGGWLAAAIALLCLVLPASAAADTFRGQTSQRKPVTIETRPDGELRKGTWRWEAGCDRKNLRLKTQTTVLRNAQRSKPGYFKAKGSYKAKFRDARIRFEVAMTGRQKQPNRWAGTFAGKAFVDLKGGGNAVCKLRKVDWAAKS
jgi:hypothetical protein